MVPPCRVRQLYEDPGTIMPSNANVQSIAALKDFRVALCLFVESARCALGEADADLRRHNGWLTEDRGRHWQSEIKRCSEQVQRAKLALLQKKLQNSASGAHPSCVDEEKALARVRRQLEDAQRKADNTKRWVRRLEELVFQHKGALQSLSYALDNDAVNMLAILERMIEALDKYIALVAPPGAGPDWAPSESIAVARPVDETTMDDPQTAAGQAAAPNPEDESTERSS